MHRGIIRGLQALGAVLVLMYAADAVVLRARISRGTAFGVVQVHQFMATPLKGQKEEYDFVGDVAVPCSRSAFPQFWTTATNEPCWWLARHTTQWQ